MTQLAWLTCQLATVLSPSVCDSRCPPSSTVCVTAVSLLTELCPHCSASLGRQTKENTHTHTHTDVDFAKSRLVRGDESDYPAGGSLSLLRT